MYSTALREAQLIGFGYDLEQELNVRRQLLRQTFADSGIRQWNNGTEELRSRDGFSWLRVCSEIRRGQHVLRAANESLSAEDSS